jgi:nitrogenase molybdenum-iron protein alpha/beta subunit
MGYGRTDDELELKNIQRIIDIQNMPEEFQKTTYYAIDAMIRVSKMEKVYAE